MTVLNKSQAKLLSRYFEDYDDGMKVCVWNNFCDVIGAHSKKIYENDRYTISYLFKGHDYDFMDAIIEAERGDYRTQDYYLTYDESLKSFNDLSDVIDLDLIFEKTEELADFVEIFEMGDDGLEELKALK